MAVDPKSVSMSFYGQASRYEPLPWTWVEHELTTAGTYWVVARSAGHPHPRPVCGIWTGTALVLSIGSPIIAKTLAADPTVSVHLDSGTAVVVVEGSAMVLERPDSEILERYDAKYTWKYSPEEYGPLSRIEPQRVLAWQSGGWAGRDGFQRSGSWRFDAGASGDRPLRQFPPE